ncbi:hypothetical protein FRC02_009343 [Tulasnella sp. 418]|nr:hypothetical protein FRC02_009343 [Tulasnella sp. 418]
MSAEEIQARLEYVEAILASQTALLAPHIESLDVNAEILPNDPSPLKRQEDIEALHSFNKQESNKIMALLRQNYNGLVGDDIGHELQNVQADLRPSSITRSLDIPIEGAGEDTIQTADTETFSTSSALEGPRIKRLRYTFEPGLWHSENGRNQVSTLPNRDAVLRDEEEVRTGELLVPPELMTVLIDEYFIRVHPLLPILHPTTFFENFLLYRSYRSEHPITSDTISGTPNSASKVLAILHALVAATIGFISDDSEACRFPHLLILIQGEKRKTELRRTAFELVVAEAMDNPTFEILQALAIIVLASIGQGSPPFAWELTGMMCRMAVQLGLNHEPPSMHREDCAGKEIGQPFQPFVLPADFLPAPQDPIEAEHRRRVFWTIVMIDRICATGTGWSVALNRRDFDVDLPCPDYLWDNHIVSAGCRPSEKSAFRWGPDASVSEESSSPRVRIWTRQHEREHGKVIALSNDISTPGQASLLLGHRQASDEAFSDYSAPARGK